MTGFIRCNRSPCTRHIGHPGPCQSLPELTLRELLELRGANATVEYDADGKPMALVLRPSILK